MQTINVYLILDLDFICFKLKKNFIKQFAAYVARLAPPEIGSSNKPSLSKL